jgi:hypothetical protein
MMIKRCFLCFFLTILCYYTSYGQDINETIDHPEVNKNAIQATVGFAWLMGAYNVNYERMIISFEKGTLVGLWSKIGFGGWGVWSTGGPYQSVTLGILTGAEKNHFELNVGGARMYNRSGYKHDQDINNYLSEPQPQKSDYVNIKLVGTAGYRYQKPNGNFLFRCGIGYPETSYVGFGVAF